MKFEELYESIMNEANTNDILKLYVRMGDINDSFE